MNTFVSSVVTTTFDLPKKGCGESVIVRPNVEKYVLTTNVAVVTPDPIKASDPILVTADGIVTDVSPLIPWKAFAPMLVIDDGIVIDVSPLIPWKELAPMLVTDDGIVIDVTPEAS